MLLTSFIWYNSTHSDRKSDVHHAIEIISHEVVGSTLVPLLVFIPISCARIFYFDRKETETAYVLEGLDSYLRSRVHATRLIGSAFLALLAPSLVTDTNSKTVVFWIINGTRPTTVYVMPRDANLDDIAVLSLEMLSVIVSACRRKHRTISEPQIANAPSHRDAMERARGRLYFAAILMLLILVALTAVTAWKLDMRLVRAVEEHHGAKLASLVP